MLLGDEARDELDFVFVQVKLATVEIAVHVGVREEDFGGAAFDDDVEDVRALQFIKGLRREDHGGVVLAPGLEGLDHVPLNGRVLQKHPRFVDEEGFENGGNLPVRDDGVGAMQDVEEQRFQKFRVLAHALEVEALKAGERNRVFGVVEEESELAAAGPFGEAARNVVPQGVRQHAQRAQRRVHRIQVFDLVEEIAFGGRVEFARPLPLNQDFQEESEEIEIFLRRRQRERVDLETLGFQAHANIGAAEKLREAFKAPAQIEDEGVRDRISGDW